MATASTMSRSSFFDRLKSAFSSPSNYAEVELQDPYTLVGKAIRVPISGQTLKLTLGTGEENRTLHLIPEKFIGDAGRLEFPSLLLMYPDTFFTQINGFVRLMKGDHLVVGREDDLQQAIFNLPKSVRKRHLSIIHDGDALLLKDLDGVSGTGLETLPAPGGSDPLTERRSKILREIRSIYGGPIQLLPPDVALHDLTEVNRILEKEPLRPHNDRGMPGGVVHLPKKMIPIILGDLHAQVDNLLTLLSQNEFIEMMGDGKATMIFLGDAVHSEEDGHLEEMENSLLIMDLILRLKLWFPQQVFYVRGNHDSFSDEIGKCGVPQGLLWAKALRDLRGQVYLDAMKHFYELLPYVALSKGYVACHAAPPRGKVSMDMLINIEKYPGLIQELTCNRLYRPNRPAGYKGSDVKRFRRTLHLDEEAELFVGHTPLTRHDTLWINVGGIEHHDVVFSANKPWIGAFTKVGNRMIPLQYRAEELLPVINALEDVTEA